MGDWDFNDRRFWRYSHGGRPIELANEFLRLLKDETAELTPIPLSGVVTLASLDNWKRFFRTVDHAKERETNHGVLQLVRHPAPGMAYVFCIRLHPDQKLGSGVVPEEMEVPTDILTLLYDESVHDWKVHQWGQPASPQDVGLRPFHQP